MSPEYLKEYKKGNLNINDTVYIIDYYQGEPYNGVLFWVLSHENERKYVTSTNLKLLDKHNFQLIQAFNDSGQHQKTQKQIKNDSLQALKEARIRKKDSLNKISLFNDCHYEENKIDEFNGSKRVLTKYYDVTTIGENHLSIQLRKLGNDKYVVFSTILDLGCASPHSNNKSFAKVKLENNEIVTFYHRDDVDCGDFTLFGRLTDSDIQKLKKSPIKIIRLSGTKYYSDIEISYFKEFFIKKLDCIK